MDPSMAYRSSSRRLRVDTGRLWSGGAATALVAVGVTIVGLLGLRALLEIPALTQWEDEIYVVYDLLAPSIAAAAAALAATGILHLLMYSTPHPQQFFAWIASLAVAALILMEFLSGSGLPDKVVTSLLYLLVGIAIVSLLHGVARTAIRYERSDDQRGHTYQPEYGAASTEQTRYLEHPRGGYRR